MPVESWVGSLKFNVRFIMHMVFSFYQTVEEYYPNARRGHLDGCVYAGGGHMERSPTLDEGWQEGR